jgi:hypothetical protein
MLPLTVAAYSTTKGDVMGTVLADFTHIMGDGPVHVKSGSGEVVFERTFDTGGIRTDQAVILMFAVVRRGNQGGPSPKVLINGVEVGAVIESGEEFFSTQTITIAKDTTESQAFNSQDNLLEITSIADSFDIKSIVCFFHQES